MAKPAILSVDDDAMVLNAVERDLRARYGQDYRILSVDSGASALELLQRLKLKNETVALFLADQRMPGMNGVEFLKEAIALFPQARRILLTAYADTEAAIASINDVSLHYYLMKPWHPPHERLYPVLDEQLEDWKTHARLPFDGIRIAGALWSAASHQVKEFLTRHQIPYQWLDIDRDESARQMVLASCSGEIRLPLIVFPDGKTLVEPDLKTLAEKVGLQTHAGLPFYDLIIIGSGPAGLAAAVYAGSEGLKCLVIERAAPGGQAGSSPRIENYLGFPTGISGDDLARRAVTQAKRFGVEILSAQEARKVSARDLYRIVTLEDGTELSAHTILIATGASFQTLKMPGASALTGAGVYYGAAYTEAMYYKDKHVFVAGGANSAAQGALYLAQFANKVTMLIRGEIGASKYLVDALAANPKIEILLNTDLTEVRGEGKVEEIGIHNNVTNEAANLKGDALFVFIGVKPQSQIVADLAQCDDKGYLLTGPDLHRDESGRVRGWTLERDPFILETNVPGVFAAGDVRFGTNHRVASAVGEGAIAMALIKQYLKSL